MNIPEGRIQAERVYNIKIKLYIPHTSQSRLNYIKYGHAATKIQLWLIVCLLIKLLITNLTSIASSFHLLFVSHFTCQYPQKL